MFLGQAWNIQYVVIALAVSYRLTLTLEPQFVESGNIYN